jgi:hypothetical protein
MSVDILSSSPVSDCARAANGFELGLGEMRSCREVQEKADLAWGLMDQRRHCGSHSRSSNWSHGGSDPHGVAHVLDGPMQKGRGGKFIHESNHLMRQREKHCCTGTHWPNDVQSIQRNQGRE